MTDKRPHHTAVWDPKCPARVLLLTNAAADETQQQQQVNYLWSHTGAASCNKHERSALIKIIQANEHYQERLDREAMALQPSKVFSRQCREALRDCLSGWMEEMRQEEATNNDAPKEKTDQEKDMHKRNMENLELLRMTYSAMMLSDVFLPLLPTNSLTTADYRKDPFGMPGAASANFVRYLRCCHMEDAELTEDGIIEMLQSTYPDQQGDGGVYWRYVETLVIRGLLEEAWKMLERHSQYQTAMAFAQSALENDPGIVTVMQEVQEDFAVIREVLLRAPIPGGRNDINDDTLGVSQMDDDEMETEFYLDGLDVGPSDYNFWQMDTSGEEMGDFPLVYSPDAAIRKHKNWQDFVRRVVRPKLHLTQRIPELKKVLAILCGDFAQIEFDGWPEKLCADILYSRPHVRPRDVNKIASSVMREFKALEEEPFAQTIINIMKGNAGMAIATFYMLGAGSGAALPTTLVSCCFAPEEYRDYNSNTHLTLYSFRSFITCSSKPALYRPNLPPTRLNSSRKLPLLLFRPSRRMAATSGLSLPPDCSCHTRCKAMFPQKSRHALRSCSNITILVQMPVPKIFSVGARDCCCKRKIDVLWNAVQALFFAATVLTANRTIQGSA